MSVEIKSIVMRRSSPRAGLNRWKPKGDGDRSSFIYLDADAKLSGQSLPKRQASESGICRPYCLFFPFSGAAGRAV